MSKLSANNQLLVQRALAWLMAIGLALLVIYGTCWLAWQAALKVPPDTARVWALLATAALPIVAWATWRLALRYAAGIVRGIDTGIGAVSEAGARAADLRVHVHREMKRPPDQFVVLPDVQITHKQLTGGNVVEL